jgi:CopG family transcriptional regulator / antitoxin EndoAI
MRKSRIVSITLPPDMFQQAEQMAKEENRTMSELMREALRAYQRERKLREEIMRSSIPRAKDAGAVESEVQRLIEEFRRERSKTMGAG